MRDQEHDDKKKWLRSVGDIDPAYIEEADPVRPMSKKRRGWIYGVAAACICLALLAVNLFLFLPFRSPVDSTLAAYQGNDYYSVIEKLFTFQSKPEGPVYKNNYEKLTAAIDNMFDGFFTYGSAAPEKSGDVGDMDMVAPGADMPTIDAPGNAEGNAAGDRYQEITDNQVAGVIEADRIKRSDRYLYYLDENVLRIFSIDEEDSRELGHYELTELYNWQEWEFYLSDDCRTVTLIANSYRDGRPCVELVSLNVSDPEKITPSGRFAITGAYLSSRLTDGRILLVTEFTFRKSSLDFSDPTTYLPFIDTGDGLTCLPPEDIVIPEEVNTPRYTVAMLLDEESLKPSAVTAFLSYTEHIYATAEHLYLAHVYTAPADSNDSYRTATGVTCLDYSGEGFRELGRFSVTGYVKDQYSFDEYNGILRMVTTTNYLSYYHLSGGYSPVSGDALQSASGASSASLWCVSMETWKVIAAVEDFAPRYEEVQSVRFDGDTAYVCTSVERSDPVFFFDLSDPEHITYKDTGTIGGYSSSLIQLGDGYLLGIGVGSDWGSFKVEVYEEREGEGNGVGSVDAYERSNCRYSTEYKSYFIDRTHQVIGLCVFQGEPWYGDTLPVGSRYILLFFDGYRLVELVDQPINGGNSGYEAYTRGVLIGEYLYICGHNSFSVVEVSALA